MDVNQHIAIDRFKDAGALDLARLEDDVAVGEHDRSPPATQPLEDVEGSGIEPIGEGVVHQIGGHRQELYISRVLDPIALQRAKIVAVAQIGEQLLEDRPVAVATGGAELALQMALKIGLNAVVVEQGVIDIDKEDD